MPFLLPLIMAVLSGGFAAKPLAAMVSSRTEITAIEIYRVPDYIETPIRLGTTNIENYYYDKVIIRDRDTLNFDDIFNALSGERVLGECGSSTLDPRWLITMAHQDRVLDVIGLNLSNCIAINGKTYLSTGSFLEAIRRRYSFLN